MIHRDLVPGILERCSLGSLLKCRLARVMVPRRLYVEKVDWYHISWSQKLSEGFIRDFSDKVNWNDISWHQTLSEDFIREFRDRVSWPNILSNQKLSDEFRREFGIE